MLCVVHSANQIDRTWAQGRRRAIDETYSNLLQEHSQAMAAKLSF